MTHNEYIYFREFVISVTENPFGLSIKHATTKDLIEKLTSNIQPSEMGLSKEKIKITIINELYYRYENNLL